MVALGFDHNLDLERIVSKLHCLVGQLHILELNVSGNREPVWYIVVVWETLRGYIPDNRILGFGEKRVVVVQAGDDKHLHKHLGGITTCCTDVVQENCT